MDDQLLREFLAEADERIEVLFADIERLRRVHLTDGRARRELIARIFRHVHTLKGSAATLPQLAAVSRLAHELENLLDAIRGGRAPLTDSAVDTCEDATNALSLALASIAQGDEATEIPPAIFKQLRQHASGASQLSVDEETNPQRNSVVALPVEMARGLSAVEQRHLSESVREGARVSVIDASFDLATLDEHFGRFTAALADRGEIVSTFPGDMAAAPDKISFRILYTTSRPRAELETCLAPFGAKIAWTDEPETAAARMKANDPDASIEIASIEIASIEDTSMEAASIQASNSSSNATPETTPEAASLAAAASPDAPILVRVPLHELDELVTATHELFTDTLAVLEGSPAPDAAPDTALHAASEAARADRARRLREDFSALEERVMSLRMQPLMPVLERATRAARIAARVAGKEIDLEITGGDVRVDRSLAEQVGEPLLHLLRNAVDHGIETAEERRAAGKPWRGRVRLEVSAEGSRVRVRVADDGRGIDAERVARAAIAGGLLEAGARITNEQALRLIFRPGFSTAGRVSAVSGRGVGLDVVEHALERAGGDVRVRTTSGEGTTFELRVPLTLALVTVVVVRASGYAYAFDASHVIATAYLESPHIEGDDTRRRSVLWHGEKLPLISLRSLLRDVTAQTGGADGPLPVIVVQRERDGAGATHSAGDAERFVIAVDRIEGEREALVRTLGRHATRWRGVSGAFAGRDGTVTLLLDLPRLLER
jgi:two-component system chemotaxis sensor kinase CheA